MRTILQKNITIEVGLIEQAAQVNVQDPPFSTEGAGGIPPVRWPRWAKSRNLYYFWLCNRDRREDVKQARWNINFSCQGDPTGGNRTGEVNKQLLPVGYLIDLEISTCSFQVGFLGDEQVGANRRKKVSK